MAKAPTLTAKAKRSGFNGGDSVRQPRRAKLQPVGPRAHQHQPRLAFDGIRIRKRRVAPGFCHMLTAIALPFTIPARLWSPGPPRTAASGRWARNLSSSPILESLTFAVAVYSVPPPMHGAVKGLRPAVAHTLVDRLLRVQAGTMKQRKRDAAALKKVTDGESQGVSMLRSEGGGRVAGAGEEEKERGEGERRRRGEMTGNGRDER